MATTPQKFALGGLASPTGDAVPMTSLFDQLLCIKCEEPTTFSQSSERESREKSARSHFAIEEEQFEQTAMEDRVRPWGGVGQSGVTASGIQSPLLFQLDGLSGSLGTLEVDLDWSMRELLLRISIASGLQLPLNLMLGTKKVQFAVDDRAECVFTPFMLGEVVNENCSSSSFQEEHKKMMSMIVTAYPAQAPSGTGTACLCPSTGKTLCVGSHFDEVTYDVDAVLGRAFAICLPKRTRAALVQLCLEGEAKYNVPSRALVQLCLEAKADANMQINECNINNDSGLWVWSSNTILGLAIKGGSKELCKLLIEKHASVDSVEEWGADSQFGDGDFRSESCLNFAIQQGHSSICQMLLESRANVNSTSTEGPSYAQKHIPGKSLTRSALINAHQLGRPDICLLVGSAVLSQGEPGSQNLARLLAST